MKKLFRLFLVLAVLFVLLVGVGLFIITRPGVQKKLVESRLPEGSSIGSVRITTGSLELSELKLALPDGTHVRVAMLDTEFDPLAAYFDHTIKLGALNVDGLIVDIPQTLIQSPSPATPPSRVPDMTSSGGQSTAAAPPAVEAPVVEDSGSPMDILYAIGEFDWLIDIDTIQLNGELRDGAGSTYSMDLNSVAIRPGQESTIETSLKLNAREPLHAGLTKFEASSRLFLKQNIDGGFEQVRLESLTSASDQKDANLLTVSQELDLSIQSFEERGSVNLLFNADLPKPEIFLPEMVGAGPFNVQGSLVAGVERSELTLTETDLLLSSGGSEMAAVSLKKSFTLGGSTNLSGDLMDIRITNLPLALLAPWMPEGLALTGSDLSARLNLSGLPGGALQLSSLEPIRLGPVSLSQDGVPLLDKVTVISQPIVRMASDQSITWELKQFQILDRYGEILSGQSVGQFNPSAPSDRLIPPGIKTETRLNLGLQEITQQPALAGYASILSGRATLDLTLDPAKKYPLLVQGKIDGISPRAYPGQRQDYRFALQLNEPKPGLLAVGANLQAGSEARPSSSLQLAGQAQPEASPLSFKAGLTSPRFSQRDYELLSSAFRSEVRPPTPVTPSLGVTPRPTPRPTPTPPPVVTADEGPAWAGYDGELNVSVAELYLLSGQVITDLKASAVVSEPRLSLNQLQAALQGGKISGKAEALYTKNQRQAYAISTDMVFENFDPVMFSKRGPGSFPVQGIFNGRAQFSGQGATIEDAADAITGEFLLTGREGVLTAFKLDNRSNLGLIGAGLLGNQLNRPGLTAMAQAIPYFENMPFSDFTFRLNRKPDGRIVIPELSFLGRNLLINGTGSIAASSIRDVMDQPLDLTLELGAKGKLVDYLETLELLGPDTSEDGFRRWAQAIQIKGSLSDPDTSVLQRILKDAANRALTQSPKDKEEAAQDAGGQNTDTEQNLQEKPSKEEKIIQDVETGLQILNSILGE